MTKAGINKQEWESGNGLFEITGEMLVARLVKRGPLNSEEVYGMINDIPVGGDFQVDGTIWIRRK